MTIFVAAGFSLRRTGETPVPPKKLSEKYSLGRNSVGVKIYYRSLGEISENDLRRGAGRPAALAREGLLFRRP
jgi:hypothetical protein